MWCEFDGSNNGKQMEENQEVSIIDPINGYDPQHQSSLENNSDSQK